MLSIQTNVNSLVAQENLRTNSDFQGTTITRLTSGYRINSSGDDAAGLSVANTFRSNTTELQQGVRNANDGLSQMQIIDGGLNNISKMLDRMKTLATQSSSATFTGNRATLNTEYSQLLSEIDRQAANVGLNTNGIFNKSISVYTGGATNGSAASNAKVTIDLSGSATAVDTKGLNLQGTSVAGAAIDMGAANTGFVTTTQTFAISTIDSSGASTTQTLTSIAGAGTSAADVVADLNNQISRNTSLANSGITFAIGSDGNLKVGGNAAFAITTTGAGATALMTGSNKTGQQNTALYNENFGAVATNTAGTAYSFTVKNSVSGDSRTISFAGSETQAQQVTAINAQSENIGIYAISDGTNVYLQSNQAFTTSASGAGAAGIGAMSGTYVAADSTLSPTNAALSALSHIQNAVTALGNTQGKVGAGENKLNYAINLAQSQISSFSAAESRIRDTDVAAEAANLTKAQVLQQASIAAMAQANSAPQAVLSLLKG